MFLFCLFLLLAMFDLGRRNGAAGHLLGVPITYALLVAVLRFRFLSSGYADVPVAFMAYAGVYALLLARTRQRTPLATPKGTVPFSRTNGTVPARSGERGGRGRNTSCSGRSSAPGRP